MNQLQQFIYAVEVNPEGHYAKSLFLEIYEEAHKEALKKPISETDPVECRYILEGRVAACLDQKCFDDYGSLPFDSKNMTDIVEAIDSWSPSFDSREEQENAGFFQGVLLSFFNRQLEMHQLFSRLHDSLIEGENLLQEKIQQLKTDPIKNSHKIQMLEKAIGDQHQQQSYHMVHADKQTFKGLSEQVKSLSTQIVTPRAASQVQANFARLINHQLVIPFNKYREERGFVKRIKDWMSDVWKKLGSPNSSTKSVMRHAISQQATFFKEAKKKIDWIFPLEIKNNK